MLPIQFGINAQLSNWVGSPVRAALVSFVVGTLALLAGDACRCGAVASLLVDDFPLGRFEEHPISLGDIAGVVLLAAGVALVRVF